MTKTAVVILNWNGKAMLERFLPSVTANSMSDRVEVIVADNASTDASVQYMRESWPNVRLIVLDRNYGFAEGYDRALEQVEAEYYVLLNSDVEVTPGWVDVLNGFMDANPDVAACQPKLLDYKDKAFFEYAGGAGGFMDSYGYMFCRGRVFDTIEKDNGQYDSVSDLFWATGACLMVRSADFWSAGGLDRDFFAHQEEIDLCWRLRSRGRRIVCVPSSVVYHVGGATLNKSNPFKTFLNFRNNLLMLYKNLPERELGRVMRRRFFLDMLAALMFAVKGQFGDMKAVFKARREFRSMKPAFAQKRKTNLDAAVLTEIPERFRFLILLKYHLSGKKTYSELVK